MKLESKLVWIRGKVTGVNDELFDTLFTSCIPIFDKTISHIKQNGLKRDNRVADKTRKDLEIDMTAEDYRELYALCHSSLYPKIYPQRIPFNPHLYHRIIGRLNMPGDTNLPNKFYFNKHSLEIEWETPPEYSEVNIIPTETGALEYVVDERGQRTYFLSRLCNELLCDSISGVADWFHQEIKGDISKKIKTDKHEKFGWTEKGGII